MIEIKTISALDKIINPSTVHPLQRASALRGELYHFGLYATSTYTWATHSLELVCNSANKDAVKIYHVKSSPVFLDNYAGHDDYVELDGEGIIPDILEEDLSALVLGSGKYLFFAIEVDCDKLPCGENKIEFLLKDAKDVEYDKAEFTLEVIDKALPKQEFAVTQWIHPDCIVHVHGVEIFSTEFFHFFRKYVQAAVRYGQNMLLTPLFTFPLDTVVSGERDNFQLVKVKVEKGGYSCNAL